MRFRTLGSRQMVVTRDANDQGAGTSVRCRCSWCSLAVAMRNKALEHSYYHRLWSFRMLVGGAGWQAHTSFLAGAWSSRRRRRQNSHHVRHRPPFCCCCCAQSPNHHIALDHAHRCAAAATYIHTPALLHHHHQLTCDHLSYTPVACIQEPRVARPA